LILTLTVFFDEGQREQPRVIKLRLRRMGAKKRPSYRIVAADSRAPRDGRFIEIIGTYDPLTDPSTVKINEERAKHWLSNGAQPTDTVRALLRREGLIPDPRATEPTANA
jgi:small subunit ribosomal protein S16